MGHARLQMTVDGVPGDQPLDQRLGILAQLPEPAGLIHAHQLFQRVLLHPLTAAQLPAIAPRGAKAHTLRLQQHHVAPGFGQMQRRREAGVAATDHADIRPGLALQRREAIERRGRRGVPAVGVLAAPVVGVKQVQGHQTFSSRCSRSQGEITCRNSSYSARFTME